VVQWENVDVRLAVAQLIGSEFISTRTIIAHATHTSPIVKN